MGNKNSISAEELRRSLNLVIAGITFGMAFFIVTGGPPLTGYIRALGAGDLVYSLIMALPVVTNVLQVFASYFMENTGKRKSIFIIFGFIHRLLWISVAIIPLVIPLSYGVLRIWAVTILITFSSAASAFVSVSFFSWMGVLVPMEIRGRFFSKRYMIYTISSAVTGLAVGWFLGKTPDFNRFAIVFAVAALFGVADILCFIWIKDPPMEVPKEKIPFFKLLLEPFGNRNYVKFIVFITLWNFGLNFAAPFFNVYMLEYLKMDYLTMILLTQVISNVSTIIFIRYWGRLVDKYGNKPVLKVCCLIAVALPTLWCFAAPWNYLAVIIISFFSGIVWPGIELTSTNLSIWLAPEKNRSMYIANYTLIVSLAGIALANVCGGIFMEMTRPVFSHFNIVFLMGQKFNSFHVLFIMSGVIRLFAVLLFLPSVCEENSKPALQMFAHLINIIKGNKAALMK